MDFPLPLPEPSLLNPVHQLPGLPAGGVDRLLRIGEKLGDQGPGQRALGHELPKLLVARPPALLEPGSQKLLERRASKTRSSALGNDFLERTLFGERSPRELALDRVGRDW